MSTLYKTNSHTWTWHDILKWYQNQGVNVIVKTIQIENNLLWSLKNEHIDGTIYNIDGLVQDCRNTIANALELLRSSTKPSTYSPLPCKTAQRNATSLAQ